MSFIRKRMFHYYELRHDFSSRKQVCSGGQMSGYLMASSFIVLRIYCHLVQKIKIV